MKYIDKENILLEFISSKNIIDKILLENKEVFNYITRENIVNKLSIELLKDVISTFINETFYCYKNIKTEKELLKIVKNYSLIEYIESKIDKSPELLFESYKYFQKYIGFIEGIDNYEMSLIISEAQYFGYCDFYKNIKKSFVKSILEKTKNKSK